MLNLLLSFLRHVFGSIVKPSSFLLLLQLLLSFSKRVFGSIVTPSSFLFETCYCYTFFFPSRDVSLVLLLHLLLSFSRLVFASIVTPSSSLRETCLFEESLLIPTTNHAFQFLVEVDVVHGSVNPPPYLATNYEGRQTVRQVT